MKKLMLTVLLVAAALSMNAQSVTTGSVSGRVVADEGAWCWFADPRAIHYRNDAQGVDATYIGYIDVHGAIKATQVDWKHGEAKEASKEDVLVRSAFQPDDHNNPTFIALPDGRIMVFYTRHTDEARIYYRISRTAGDITRLGDEKIIKVANNTTYPSPFILSDDPEHIYLCWRGIGWHPTLARLTMPDAQDDVTIDYGPYQLVQSTGARPYAKYQSNGKDKIYVAYTTGHPDNEMPNWLYFNVVDINHGNGAILRDLTGKQLSVVKDGKFQVNKTDAYATSYPATIVDRTQGVRNWVWQIALDSDERPVIAYTHIDNAKTTHEYHYAHWTGSAWRTTKVSDAGHAFHLNWNSTERCYSGGMAIDPDTTSIVYAAVPMKDGQFNRDGVYEIMRYRLDNDMHIVATEAVTQGSAKNNVRPYVLPGSAGTPLRLVWMNGDYYYWIVSSSYPKGYPTGIRAEWLPADESPTTMPEPKLHTVLNRTMRQDDKVTVAHATDFDGEMFTLSLTAGLDAASYGGTILAMGALEFGIDATTLHPYVKIGTKRYDSQNFLGTSDAWATGASGTDGKSYLTHLSTFHTALIYDGHTLTVMRNGWIDQRIDVSGLQTADVNIGGFNGTLSAFNLYSTAITQQTVRHDIQQGELNALSLAEDVHTDMVLPARTALGSDIAWTSSRPDIMGADGVANLPSEPTEVTLTATTASGERTFTVMVHPRELASNLRHTEEVVDLSANAPTAFDTNKCVIAPEGLLRDLRSYTFMMRVRANGLTLQPRLYDFGSGSGNSVFLRANPLAAGVKYSGGTTTLVSAANQLETGREYALAVTYDAATKMTRIYVDGKEAAAGTANLVEAWQLAALAPDTRNYIGRTQWWDSSVAADNADFCGRIDDFRLYDIALTRAEICALQQLTYEEETLPATLSNADFEGTYQKMSGSGVSLDRAIYVPEGWSTDLTDVNSNDLTALAAGDLYFKDFFASLPTPQDGGNHTYWTRQKWGASTITLRQLLRPAAGEWTLSADVYQNGTGGQAAITVTAGQARRFTAPTLSDQDAWQHVSVDFDCNGTEEVAVALAAVHTANGSEKIIGFDNVALVQKTAPDGIIVPVRQHKEAPTFDLSGRRTSAHNSFLRGMYIQGGVKVLRTR